MLPTFGNPADVDSLDALKAEVKRTGGACNQRKVETARPRVWAAWETEQSNLLSKCAWWLHVSSVNVSIAGSRDGLIGGAA